MTTDKLNHCMEALRKVYRRRPSVTPPPGFDAAIMAEIRALVTSEDIIGLMLPRLSMAAMVLATVAMVYGMSILDTIPSALADMYGSSAPLGF